MLTIVQRGGATREKPPEVVRGQASRMPWAWDSLCFAVPFNDATEDSARDVITNAAPSGSAGLAWERDNRGNVAAFLNDTAYLEYPDDPRQKQPTTAITVYARIRRAGSSADAGAGIVCKRISTTSPFSSWIMQQSDSWPGAVAGYLSVNNSNDIYFPGVYQLPSTTWHSAFIRWSTGLIPRIDIYDEHGELKDFEAFTEARSGTITYAAAEPVRINAGEVTTANFHAAYSQVMVWSRRLSDVEIQAIIADPYGWYSPRRETIGLSSPYPLAFGAGEMKFGTGSGGPR